MKEKQNTKISRLHKTDYKNMEILPPHKEVHEFPDDTGRIPIQMNIALSGKYSFADRCDKL